MADSTPISDVMQREFVSLGRDDQLDFAEDVMSLGRIRHLPVLVEGRLVGLVSQRDLLSASLSKVLDFEADARRSFLRSVAVSEVMSTDVISVEPKTPISEAARLMVRYKVGCIPVVDGVGTLLGLVTEVDLLRSIYGVDEP